jgi:hypothetical protein
VQQRNNSTVLTTKFDDESGIEGEAVELKSVRHSSQRKIMEPQDVFQEPIDYFLETNSDVSQMADPVFADLDNDGTFESVLEPIDTDGDGKSDTWVIQTDIDNDGVSDYTLLTMEEDYDGESQIGASNVATDNMYEVVGNPENNEQFWHLQTQSDTCAIASQQFILEELTGQNLSEDELRQFATDNGWYTPGGGTPLEHMGNLVEAYGFDVEKQNNCSWEDLNQCLANNQQVMVAIDADEIWNPTELDEDDNISEAFGIPGQGVNHAVEVTGIDNSDPNNPMVILNDPGHPNGKGMKVSAEQFMDAWADSGNYMVYTTGYQVA